MDMFMLERGRGDFSIRNRNLCSQVVCAVRQIVCCLKYTRVWSKHAFSKVGPFSGNSELQAATVYCWNCTIVSLEKNVWRDTTHNSQQRNADFFYSVHQRIPAVMSAVWNEFNGKSVSVRVFCQSRAFHERWQIIQNVCYQRRLLSWHETCVTASTTSSQNVGGDFTRRFVEMSKDFGVEKCQHGLVCQDMTKRAYVELEHRI